MHRRRGGAPGRGTGRAPGRRQVRATGHRQAAHPLLQRLPPHLLLPLLLHRHARPLLLPRLRHHLALRARAHPRSPRAAPPRAAGQHAPVPLSLALRRWRPVPQQARAELRAGPQSPDPRRSVAGSRPAGCAPASGAWLRAHERRAGRTMPRTGVPTALYRRQLVQIWRMSSRNSAGSRYCRSTPRSGLCSSLRPTVSRSIGRFTMSK